MLRAKGVRKVSAHGPGPVFARARLEVLEDLRGRQPLFRTAVAQRRWGPAAARNRRPCRSASVWRPRWSKAGA